MLVSDVLSVVSRLILKQPELAVVMLISEKMKLSALWLVRSALL